MDVACLALVEMKRGFNNLLEFTRLEVDACDLESITINEIRIKEGGLDL